ncbi:hypothetical protein ABIB57_002915 [Devosia sp. UYZn731]|uniref:hypothetical protein n=1 Tax=Devosia sp. UYZn731 TaxID=3156345 RepID=UPI003394A6FE
MRRAGLITLSLLVLSLPLWAQASNGQEKLPAGLKVGDSLGWGWDIFKDCTSQVFALDEATALAIEKDGLSAFTTMSGPIESGEWRYAPWQQTPVDSDAQADWSVDGYVWGGLACGLSAEWQARSAHIGTEPGAYYSFGRGVLLLVDPGQRLVVFTQRDSLH